MNKKKRLHLAIDGMGGDSAPHVIVEGVALAKERVPSLSVTFFGDQEKLSPLLKKYKLSQGVEVVHTPVHIPQDMLPTQALKERQGSSMHLALQAVRKGEADGVVSAGNTGAYLILSKLILRTWDGISRPTIVSTVPHEKGDCILLDLGANLQTSAQTLVEFALMGESFARHVLFKSAPKIGLLNVGSEDVKGPPALRKAYKALKALPINFSGFIEGDDITKGVVDVVVTDGFSGNLVLKAGEGVMRFVFQSLKETFSRSWRGRLAGFLARPLLQTLRLRFDPRCYNGAFWLGLQGVAVKSHGGADAYAFSYAVDTAIDMIRADLQNKMREDLEKPETQAVLGELA
jgi:glycerol-3-phosphate acyltransferase PlsX